MRTKRWGAVLLALLLFAQVFVGSQFSLDEVAYASALSEEQTPLNLQDTQPEDFEFDPLHKRITGFKEERAEAEEWNLTIPKQIDGVDVESIDGLAFYNNPHIHQVDFSQATALKQIGAYAFAFTPLDKIDLSQSNVEQMENPFVGFGTDDPIEVLEIPSLDLRMPLYLSATEGHLQEGAAVVDGTSLPLGGLGTRSVIAGHRGWYDAPYFRDLDVLVKGDRILLHVLDQTLLYTVENQEVITPQETEKLRLIQKRMRLRF